MRNVLWPCLLVEGSKAAGKRKAVSDAVIILDDGEEDVKPLVNNKARSSAGSSKDQAIDLTDL